MTSKTFLSLKDKMGHPPQVQHAGSASQYYIELNSPSSSCIRILAVGLLMTVSLSLEFMVMKKSLSLSNVSSSMREILKHPLKFPSGEISTEVGIGR